MELVCIVCPRGCRITVDGDNITGNTCKKGLEFAKSEMTCPMRTVCSTVATSFSEMPVLPVRTNGEIPKVKIKELMTLINSIVVDKKVKKGDIIAENIVGTSVNLIATESVF